MPDATILDYFKRLDKSHGQKRRTSSQPRNEVHPPPKKSRRDEDADPQKHGVPRSTQITLHTCNHSGDAPTPSRGQTPIGPNDDQQVVKSALPASLGSTEETTPHLSRSYATAARRTAPMASTSLYTPPLTVRPREKRAENPLNVLFDPLSLPHFPPPQISPSPLPLPSDGRDHPQIEESGDENKAATSHVVLTKKTGKNTFLQPYSEVASSSAGSNYPSSLNKNENDNLRSLSPESEMVTVPSSQTQLLYPGFLLSSPQHRIQRPPGKSAYRYDDLDDLDIVQSSQSIEKEVDISMGLSQFLPTPSTSSVSSPDWGEPERRLMQVEERPQPSSPSAQWRPSQSHPPARSQSEVLYGFPMQEPEIANLFLDDPVQEPDPPLPSAPRSHSATESDSDNEDHFSHNVSQFRKANCYLIRNSSPTQPTKHDLLADPTSDNPIVGHSSPSSQSSNSIPQSLPECVKEFRDMFDNDDGSYPSDFPEDLR